MGSATSLSIRRLIIKEKLEGKTLRLIAEENHLSYSTTCTIWQRYKLNGIEGLAPSYKNCGPKRIKSSYKIYRSCLWLKRLHSSWGAPVIKTILEERYPETHCPSVRTMQIWFSKAGYNAPRAYRKEPPVSTIKEVHDCWQIDAKENLKLQDGTKACYLTSVDVKSGIVLGTPVFPQRKD